MTMKVKTVQINHPAVWILVVFNMILGFVWYSPYFFGNEWMKLLGKDMEFFKNAGIMPFIVAFITSVVTMYTLAWFFKKLQVKNFFMGLTYGVMIWFGFVFCELLTIDQFELRHYGLTWLNAGKALVSYAVAGFLLGFWNRFSETEAPDIAPANVSPEGSNDRPVN